MRKYRESRVETIAYFELIGIKPSSFDFQNDLVVAEFIFPDGSEGDLDRALLNFQKDVSVPVKSYSLTLSKIRGHMMGLKRIAREKGGKV